jgi:hypothetical protein
MLTIRTAVKADAAVLCDAERRTAMTPGLLASRPDELRVETFEEKIVAAFTRGCYRVAEIDGKIVGHAFLGPIGSLAAISHVFTLTISATSSTTGTTAVVDGTLWFAKGIGMIRSEQSGTSLGVAGPLIEELVSTNLIP